MKTLWLDELNLEHAYAGWGVTRANRSSDGNVLTIAGEEFDRGLGTHALGEFSLALDGRASAFRAQVGLDSEVTSAGSIEFVVVGDGRVLARSGVMRNADAARPIEADLEGIQELRLVVTDGGDGINYDHADWAMARITYAGEPPLAKEPLRVAPYVLTPKPGPEPRITGPKVFGARPGNPFLFTVTATGTRPMTFAASGLPDGLQLDSGTGRITGTVEEAGEYAATVTARNPLGEANRVLTIKIGDTISLTPPLGWNSWNCWACAVDDEKVRASARAMVDSGLINHGWSYINIDDCWMRRPGSDDPAIGEPVRDAQGRILTNTKFPDMKGLTDFIHGLGLKVGIYISPGPTTCAQFVGSWQHELDDARQFAEWGFDYLKYDWCGYSRIAPNPSLEQMKEPYALMRQQLDQVRRDIVYSLCQYGMGAVWEWGADVGGNCWRTTGDITDSWTSMAGIGFRQADLSPHAGPGHWNDPDMLVVGKVGWGPNLRDSRLTPDEQYTHISLWCLLSSPLLIGCPLEQLDAFTLNLLTNDEVLDVNQDPLGQQARRFVQTEAVQIWAKDMEDGSKTVGLFNTDGYQNRDISLDWSAIDLPEDSEWTVRDLWRQQDLGDFRGSFTARDVPAHGVVLVRLSAD
jgi:alpha-galactosidase